jgi:hypothetical protein
VIRAAPWLFDFFVFFDQRGPAPTLPGAGYDRDAAGSTVCGHMVASSLGRILARSRTAATLIPG